MLGVVFCRTASVACRWLLRHNLVKIPFPMRESIFVVDDEPLVLNVVSGILRRAGYNVLTAGHPADALRLGSATSTPIHVLVTDDNNPGMSGPSLAERFTVLHPESVPVFMAGMPDSQEVLDRILGPGRAFLPKPFSADTLLRKVREVLASETGELVA